MPGQNQQPVRLTAYSADSPYKICQAYADGKITREQVIAELGSWPYKPRVEYDPIDQLPLTSSQGTWMEVQLATGDGLIDYDIYGQAQEWKNRLRDA